MKIFFTADTHFGHENILEHCNRPYKSIQEMDMAILDGINSVVGEKDLLYHLGDFAWTETAQTIKHYRAKINCRKIILIKGNHDKRQSIWKSGAFHEIHDLLYLKVDRQKFVLSHYPFHSWRRTYIHLHGHTHNTPAHCPIKTWRIDVGWDHDYKVWSIDNVLEVANSGQEPGKY